MPRKNSQPDEVKIKRERPTDKGLEVDLLIRWNIQEKQEEDMDEDTITFWEYDEEKYTITLDAPRNDVDSFIENNKNILKIKGKAKAEHKRNENVLKSAEKDELKNSRGKKGRAF